MPPQIEVLLLAAGVALVVLGATLISWPAGLLAFGVLLILAAVDLRR